VRDTENTQDRISSVRAAYNAGYDRFRQLVENLREVFWLKDSRGFIYVSPTIEKVWGRPSSYFYKNPQANFELMHPEDRKRLQSEYSVRRFRGDEIFKEEFRILLPDGRMRWISSRSFPLRDNRGQTVYRAGICEDITERKLYELSLAEREEQLFQILQQMPYPIEVLDNEGTAVMVNKAFLTLYEIKDEQEIIGRFNVFREKTFRENGLFKHFKEAFRGRAVHIPEFIMTQNSPGVEALIKKYHLNRTEDVAVEITIFPVFSHTGEIWRVVSIRKDISQLIQHKKSLEQKNIALKEILAQIELEKLEMKNKVKQNLERLVFPYLIKLSEAGSVKPTDKTYVELIKNNLDEICSTLVQKTKDHYASLSPREIEICSFIKAGLSNKEIASALSLSLLTVEKHRQHIRKKLGITSERVNLHTYLQQTRQD
jgi:PAS domain S-box-containing protein